MKVIFLAFRLSVISFFLSSSQTQAANFYRDVREMRLELQEDIELDMTASMKVYNYWEKNYHSTMEGTELSKEKVKDSFFRKLVVFSQHGVLEQKDFTNASTIFKYLLLYKSRLNKHIRENDGNNILGPKGLHKLNAIRKKVEALETETNEVERKKYELTSDEKKFVLAAAAGLKDFIAQDLAQSDRLLLWMNLGISPKDIYQENSRFFYKLSKGTILSTDYLYGMKTYGNAPFFQDTLKKLKEDPEGLDEVLGLPFPALGKIIRDAIDSPAIQSAFGGVIFSKLRTLHFEGMDGDQQPSESKLPDWLRSDERKHAELSEYTWEEILGPGDCELTAIEKDGAPLAIDQADLGCLKRMKSDRDPFISIFGKSENLATPEKAIQNLISGLENRFVVENIIPLGTDLSAGSSDSNYREGDTSREAWETE